LFEHNIGPFFTNKKFFISARADAITQIGNQAFHLYNLKNELFFSLIAKMIRESPTNNCRRPRGFSMIAHCKALGKIPRTSKKNKGKYIVSPKYKKRSSRRRK
jgi:hypothetical protein